MTNLNSRALVSGRKSFHQRRFYSVTCRACQTPFGGFLINPVEEFVAYKPVKLIPLVGGALVGDMRNDF